MVNQHEAMPAEKDKYLTATWPGFASSPLAHEHDMDTPLTVQQRRS